MCPERGIAFSDEVELRPHGKEHDMGSMGEPGETTGEKPYGEE
jgi:hypothetical protein